MYYESFVLAYNRLFNFDAIFALEFADFGGENRTVPFANIYRFFNQVQADDHGTSPEATASFLRHYLRDAEAERDLSEPYLRFDEVWYFYFFKDITLYLRNVWLSFGLYCDIWIYEF